LFFPKCRFWTANEEGRGLLVVREAARKFLVLYIVIRQYSRMAMEQQADRLSLVFAALADPTRRAMLARLASGDADVSELMKPFALRQPTISKHLSVLERAGLVMSKRDAQRRPRTLVAIPMKDVADWIEPFRRFWEQRFASLDGYLEEMKKKEKAHGRKKR
jgi:DNA-binding transcriptional ArsR family regulator